MRGLPEFIVDNVRVTRVPEPSTMIVGLLALLVLTLWAQRSAASLANGR